MLGCVMGELALFGLCCALGVSLLTYAFFWYEAANSSYRVDLEKLSGGKLGRLMTKGIFCGFLSAVCLILFYPLGYWRKLWQPCPKPDCSLPPVVLVHGLYHNPSAWILFRRRLRRAGFDNITTMSYSSFRFSFHELRDQLGGIVSDVSHENQGRSVILVGHSLGGLLCRAYVETSNSSSSVAAVATLGTPHQGSKVAALGLGKLAQSLIYRGPLIRDLEEKRKPSQIPRLAFTSPLDNMVLPHEALRVPFEGWRLLETRPISHVGMLYDPGTARSVISALKSVCTR